MIQPPMNLSRHLPTLAFFLLSGGLSPAFPPAPYYTRFGTVRDQTGQIVQAEGAELILLKGTTVASRASIHSGVQLDQNYELSARIDQARPATSLYARGAVPAQGQFSLAVEMGGKRYLPIEVKGNLTAGKGGERVRLDLSLGEDSDGDGLPDAWEQWQLFQAGEFPVDRGWDLSKLDRQGDLDGDAQNNWTKYLAGTFAGDATERFVLDIKSMNDSAVSLEFFGITGKTYTIESSTDLKSWTRVPFAAGTATTGSKHSEKVYANQAGGVRVTWITRQTESGKYRTKQESFSVSSATTSPINTIFWTANNLPGDKQFT